MVSSHFRKFGDFYFSLTEIIIQSWFAPPEDIPVMIDRSNDHPPSPPRRDRSLAGRRKARADKAARERRIVNLLNAGVSVAEIAQSEGVTDRNMRVTVREILARRAPEPPAEFLAVQVSRLSEALLVSYSAMGGGNLEAVDRVVKIVRELDRYHGFAGISHPARTEQGRLAASAPIPLALAAPDRSPEGNGAASA
jgi:DNA-binding CsgD family transcriptional regulator